MLFILLSSLLVLVAYADVTDEIEQLKFKANSGDIKAMSELGKKYEEGIGVPQNYVTAHFWYNLSQRGVMKKLVNNRDAIAKLMSPDQIAEAQKLASKWKPTDQKNVTQIKTEKILNFLLPLTAGILNNLSQC